MTMMTNNPEVRDIRQLVLDGTVRSRLEEDRNENVLDYGAVGLTDEYRQLCENRDLIELLKSLSRRTSERHAVILSVTAVATLATSDPHIRIKQLSAAAYIESELLPHLTRTDRSGNDDAPLIATISRILGVKG
jgi:hypothetical protein